MEAKEPKKRVIKYKKVKKSVKDGEKLKRKKTFGCKIVKVWFATNTTNPYTTDLLQAKHKSNGDFVLTLRDSNDDSVKYALPTRDEGFLVVQEESEPNVCVWMGIERQYKKIGYLLIFETEEKAKEFYKFTQQRNKVTEPIKENGDAEGVTGGV
ncbi:hypothetical protein ACQ4LE_002425 [Meloidogyne hapla]|uniref:WH1 domain-containing protein n=1 Tax=Meloidogyne hapla TaxID=6305 RepID=A0A1I8BS93_MELHA